MDRSANPSGGRRAHTTPMLVGRMQMDPSHLFSLPCAANPNVKLIVHEVDIIDDEAVLKSIEGYRDGGVFHLASSCTLEDPVYPQLELVEHAVNGTLNVLKAAKEFFVRRVVVTSSISAIVPNLGWPEGKVFDESSWADLDYCKTQQFDKFIPNCSAIGWDYATSMLTGKKVNEYLPLSFSSSSSKAYHELLAETFNMNNMRILAYSRHRKIRLPGILIGTR